MIISITRRRDQYSDVLILEKQRWQFIERKGSVACEHSGYAQWIELDSMVLGVWRTITTKVGRTSDRERASDFTKWK